MSVNRAGSALLAVVVPVYGGASSLPSFLDSLIAQTFQRWTALLVIDGSPGGSESVARDYAARDDRITVRSFANGGVGRAKNLGVTLVESRYVTFPDPDDMLAPNAYELLVGSLESSGSDIATGIGEDILEDGRRETSLAQSSALFDSASVGITLRSHPKLVLDHVAWNKVYRTALLRERPIEFSVDTGLGEDVVHSLTALSVARAVDVVPSVVYFRRRSGAPTSVQRSTAMLADWQDQTRAAMELVALIDEPAVSHEYFVQLLDFQVWSRISRFDDIDDSAIESLERFARYLLGRAPASALAQIPFAKRVLVKFFAEGHLSRLWRMGDVVLNPMVDSETSPLMTVETAARSLQGLRPTVATERLMLRYLIDSIAEHVLESGAEFSDAGWESVFAHVAAGWPAGFSTSELSSSVSVPVIEATRSADRRVLLDQIEVRRHNVELMQADGSGPTGPLLSVVVPIYGVEQWLAEFLDSLLEQSFLNWQAILVIDGSPDSSEAIARDYATRDPRFSVHVFENGGLGRARNRGFELATGTFVTFPDPDDLLSSRSYELLVGSLLLSGSDISTGKAQDFFEDGTTVPYWAQRSQMFAQATTGLTLATEPDLILDHVAWNKVFRTSLLRDNGIEYPVDTLCEDVVHSLRAIRAAAGVDVIPEVIYHHRRRDNAITSNLYSARIVNDWIEQTSQAMELVRDIQDDEVTAAYFTRLLGSELWTRVRAFNQIDDDASFARLERFAAAVLAADSTGAVEQISLRTRTMLELTADGTIGRVWRTPGFALNPMVERVESPVLDMQVKARSASLLTAGVPLEQVAQRILLDEIAVLLLVHSRDLSDRQFDSLLVELRTALPKGLAVETRASPESAPLLTAAVVGDRARLRELSTMNIRRIAPEISAIKRHGNAVLFTGVVRLDVTVDDQTAMEVVLRSRTSAKVRAITAVHWTFPDAPGEPVHWRAVVTDAPDLLDEEWVVWLRASRNSLPSIQARVAVGETLVDAAVQILPMKTTVVSVHDDEGGLIFSLAARQVQDDSEAVATRYAQEKENASDLPDRISVFPYWRSNPYIEMLYLGSQSRGVKLSGTVRFDDMIDDLARATDRDIFHLHWTAPIAQRAETEQLASAQVATFKESVLAASERGVQIYWTVHNKLPHELRYRDLELELCRFLAATADVVHVMSDHTVEAVADTFDISHSEVLVIEHSSYLGIYGSGPGREAARNQLGIADSETAVLFLGRLLPYKGIITLLKAMQSAGERRGDLVLLLAGEPDPDYLKVILDSLPTSVRVISHFDSVPDDEIALWFSAADVEALPYEEILNSGSVYLAATFGVPVLMPNVNHLQSQFADEPWVVFFDRTDPVAAIADAVVNWTDPDGALAHSASKAARTNTPFAMSSQFADGISRLRRVRKAHVSSHEPGSSRVS